MSLAFETHVRVGDAARSERLHHRLGLVGWHHPILHSLEEDHRAGETLGEVDRRTLAVEIAPLRVGPHQAVHVAGLELVRVAGQRLEVADAVVAGARCEDVVEGQCAQNRVATSAAAADRESRRVGRALLAREACRVHAVGDVDHAPVAAQPIAIGAPEARAAPVVDIDHREAAAGPELDAQSERRVGGAGRPAVALDQKRRLVPNRRGSFGIRRAVEKGVGDLTVSGLKLHGLGNGDEGRVDLERQALAHRREAVAGEVEPADHGSPGGRRGDQRGLVALDAHAVVGIERESDRVERAVAQIEPAEPLAPALAYRAEDRVLVHEVPGRQGEGPLGPPELGGARAQGNALAVAPLLEVPPARAIGDVGEHALG